MEVQFAIDKIPDSKSLIFQFLVEGKIISIVRGFPDKNNSFRIYQMETESNWQRKGYGLRLLKKVINYCKTKNFSSITLTACPLSADLTMQNLIVFYKKAGFLCDKKESNKMTLLL